ncbi:hypothetical protein SDC9_54055 [bioreactor metagenome]|uniref:Type I restriction modification DNA specificity domain-containing protein n=1 Tax=bioreactor metagenome TaxID=1076179 RepID=A0A644WW89_9ZZZZ
MSNLIHSKLLRDIIKLDKGKPPAQEGYYGLDAVLYLTPDYLRGGAQPEHIKPSSNAVHVKDGETIILWDGSNAGEIFRSKKGVLASTMARVKHCEDYDNEYFFFALKVWESYLKGQTSGSGIPHVDKEVLGRLTLIQFPKREQSKIAEILSKVEQAIEQTENLITKQQRIKKGLMQDLLTRGIDEHGNLRSEDTHEFKDSPLGRIPVDWVCSLLSYFVPSAEYGISTPLGDFGTPVVRMNNFSEGEAEVSDLKYTELMPPEKLWLRDGDVLFNRTNSWEHVGRTGIWRCQIVKATFASYLVRLNPDPDRLLSEMLNIWLNWEPTQIAMRRTATPAVQQVNINPTNLRSIYAAFPICLNEQGEIVKRLESMRKTIGLTMESLAKLYSLKTALMQDLLTGNRLVTPLLRKTEGHS